MKIECQIEKIKNAVSKAERITSKNPTLPALSSVLITTGNKSIKIRATNLSLGVEIEIPAIVKEEGSIVVNGGILGGVLNNLTLDNNVIIETSKENLLIKTKNNQILIKTYAKEDFPTIPSVSDNCFKVSAKKFINGIKSVYYSASISDIKQEISSVYIYPHEENIVFVATDSFRLAEKKIKIKKPEDFSGVLIPFKNITEIIRFFDDSEDDLSICLNKNLISFSLNGIYLTSRLIDGSFPDYNQIIPKESATEVVVLKQDLLNALKISNIFSDKFNQVSLKIKPKDKFFEMSSQNNDVGENKTKIEASVSGEDLEINLNQKYFIDCFQSIGQDSLILSFNQNNRPVVVRGVGDSTMTYLIMPMNR